MFKARWRSSYLILLFILLLAAQSAVFCQNLPQLKAQLAQYNVQILPGPLPVQAKDLARIQDSLKRLPPYAVTAIQNSDSHIYFTSGSLSDIPATRKKLSTEFKTTKDGRVYLDLDTVSDYENAEGKGMVYITPAVFQTYSNFLTSGTDVPGGSANVILHEVAHMLDNMGGNNVLYYDYSSTEPFLSMFRKPEVQAYLRRNEAPGSGYLSTYPEEAFAEMFARYYASERTRQSLPGPAKSYYTHFRLKQP